MLVEFNGRFHNMVGVNETCFHAVCFLNVRLLFPKIRFICIYWRIWKYCFFLCNIIIL